MKILAIDIGTGTQDILLYNDEKEFENSIKLVLPSPHLIIGQKIKKTEKNIYFEGEIMGGGKLKKRILEHMEKNYDVIMEEKCAKTIRDNLDEVKKYGIKIKEENKDYTGYERIKLGDINIKKLSNLLREYDLEFDFDIIAIAVQDHGYNKNKGDRDFRFEKIREKLKEPIEPEKFGYKNNIPKYYTRMKSVENILKKEKINKKTIIMDTKFASICGMCEDKIAKSLKSYVVIDIGNGHTTAASIENGKIQGIFEHHTSNLNSEKLKKYIEKLSKGVITNEEIYNDHGHGAHVINPISKLEKVIVTGPRRKIIENSKLDWIHATPGGDVMMTGTVGLIKTAQELEKC